MKLHALVRTGVALWPVLYVAHSLNRARALQGAGRRNRGFARIASANPRRGIGFIPGK